MTKNITLTISEDVLDKVRVLAARQKTSVNALVREFLEAKAKDADFDQRRREAVAKLLDMSRNSNGDMKAGWRFDREDIYAERLSGHEHRAVRGGRAKK